MAHSVKQGHNMTNSEKISDFTISALEQPKKNTIHRYCWNV